MTIGKATVASPEGVASQGETTVLVLPLEVNLALMCRVLPTSEVRRASLLALSHALPLALWKSVLALGAESNARSATLLARIGALVLASRAAGLILPNSVVEASKAVITSLKYMVIYL